MSTIRTTTLAKADGSSSVPVDTVINGTAKAWVNFNGTGTVAIRTSFNVSSITDNGVGTYTVNFTISFIDTNYSVVCSGVNAGVRPIIVSPFMSAPTTSAASLYCVMPGGSVDDPTTVCAAVFR